MKLSFAMLERLSAISPKHGVPFRGNGWVYAAGHRFGMFECPKPLCKRFHLWRDTGEATATIGQQDGGK